MRGTTGAVLSPQGPAPRKKLFSVLVVDDHPLVRESIAARSLDGRPEVVEAATVAEARARAHASGPCDLASSTSACPTAPASTCSPTCVPRLAAPRRPPAADDPYSVRAAFVAGAQGYLLKSASPFVVADGVRGCSTAASTPTRRSPPCWPPAAGPAPTTAA